MGKWITENKLTTISIIVLAVIVGINPFGQQPVKIYSAEETKSSKKEYSFKRNVLSFETLNQAEKYEDLVKYGLVSPQQYNHTSGKNLILLAIKANSFFKGDWVAAHGILGTNMLDVEVKDRIGHKSLFLSLHVAQGFKLYAMSVINNIALLANIDGTVLQAKSIIARREAALYSIANHLESRYIFNDAGNYGRNYSPEPNRRSNERLKTALLSGLKVYNQLFSKGFNDKTLRDSLCIAHASLDYDGVFVDHKDIYKLGSLQVCMDALKAALAELASKKDHSANFLSTLGWQMRVRDIAYNDKILLPEDEKNFEAMIQVFEEDLDTIKK